MTLRHRLDLELTARRLRRQPPVPPRPPARFEVDAWVLSRFVVDRLVPAVGVHPFPVHELLLIAAAMCHFRPARVYAWGTDQGTAARVCSDTALRFGIPTRIHWIEVDDGQRRSRYPRRRAQLVRRCANVQVHRGDGVDVALRLWATEGGPPRPLFVVDGDREYAAVRRELEGILTVVPHPIVLVHDTFPQEPGGGVNGPHDAVRDVLHHEAADRLERVDSGIGLPGLTLLYPRAPEAAPPAWPAVAIAARSAPRGR